MIQINVPQRHEFKARPPNVVAIAFMLIPTLVGIALTVATKWPGFAIAGLILGVVLIQSPHHAGLRASTSSVVNLEWEESA